MIDLANRLVEETRIGPSSTTIVTTATYDGADNLRVVTLPNGNQVTRTYDAVNRLDTIYDSVGAILDLGYDENGNITSRADGLGHTWQYQYDQADRPIKLYDPLIEGGADKYTSLTYDGLGNRLTATDNNGITTGFEYDKLSRLTKAVEHKNGTGDTANTQTVYTYDGMGRVKTMADHNGNTTTYLYDDAGRLTDITFPDPSPNTLHYTYGVDNKSPKPITRTDQKGVVTTFEWDNMYRLLQRTYPSRSDTFTYDRSGRLLTANNSLVNETFEYDILGRVTSLTQAYGASETYTTTVSYAIGTPDSTATVTYPASREVVYTFDGRFRMTSVSGGTGVGVTRGLDLADQVISSSFANGVSSVFDYDVNGRMTHMERFKNGEPPTMLVKYDYGYDAVGNRLYTRDLMATDRSELYGYDARNRLRNFARGTLNAGPRARPKGAATGSNGRRQTAPAKLFGAAPPDQERTEIIANRQPAWISVPAAAPQGPHP